MTAISSHALQPRTEQAIKASKTWSLRALQIAQQALKENGDQVTDAASATCARAKTVGFQNMGMLAEASREPSRLLLHAISAQSTNMSVLPAEVQGALSQLLQALSSPDNTLRTQAEEQLNNDWTPNRPDMLLMGLVEQLQAAEEPSVS